MSEIEIGLVTRLDSRVCWVRLEDGARLKCPIRGRLFRERPRVKNPVAVGDRVQVLRVAGAAAGRIEGVEPRRNWLSRPVVASTGRREQVIVANVDYLAAVVAAARPPLRPGLIDRYLIVAARQALEPLVVVNKVDLADRTTLEAELSIYTDLGRRVVYTSAATGEGVAGLRALIGSKITVLSGHSGVGKSTLITALQPGLEIATRQVSRRSGKGVHTTTQVTLYELAGGGCLIDTPGLRALGLWQLEPGDVDAYFDEITREAAGCRFRTCAHREEPDCAVKAAVARGAVDARRFASYRRIYESLATEERQRGY